MRGAARPDGGGCRADPVCCPCVMNEACPVPWEAAEASALRPPPSCSIMGASVLHKASASLLKSACAATSQRGARLRSRGIAPTGLTPATPGSVRHAIQLTSGVITRLSVDDECIGPRRADEPGKTGESRDQLAVFHFIKVACDGLSYASASP